MTWSAPWALIGLLALPLIWWLHRRLKKPPRVDLPSLMFLLDEDEAHALPRGRPFDAELLLALAAAAALVLGAAGPRLETGSARRTLRVVVSAGAAAEALGYRERVRALLADARRAASATDRFDVVFEPASAEAPRPLAQALLAAARAGPASLRMVVSDAAPPGDTGEVLWIALGDPDASNQGIVAVSVRAADGGLRVFCNVANESRQPTTLAVRAETPGDFASASLHLEPETPRALELPLDVPQGSARDVVLSLRAPDGSPHRDSLAADDRVVLTRAPLRVFVSPALPAGHRDRTRLALEAALGERGVEWLGAAARRRAGLAVLLRGETAPADRWTLFLQPIPEGAAVERAPAGADPVGHDALVRDLSTSGAEWVYEAGAQEAVEGESVLLARRAARSGSPSRSRSWPVLLRADRRVRLAPDPLRGHPAPADTPFWPLLVENLAGCAGGRRGVGEGYRAEALLDGPTTRLGRTRTGFDANRLRTAPPTSPAPARVLRPPLAAGALVLMALLWAAPRIRRRLDGGPRRSPARLTRRQTPPGSPGPAGSA